MQTVGTHRKTIGKPYGNHRETYAEARGLRGFWDPHKGYTLMKTIGEPMQLKIRGGFRTPKKCANTNTTIGKLREL